MLQAVTTKPRSIAIGETAPVEPRTGEALVRIERVGICGSDLHIFSGHHPRATFPRIQGHEGSAIVEQLGPAYSGELRTGQRVAIDPLLTCGRCYPCSIGRSSCCTDMQVIGAHVDGFLQEYFIVPAGNVYPVGDLTADETALVEPVSVGHRAISRGSVEAGEQIVIIGAGPIGLCAAIAAIDRGARVMMIDTLPSRLELANAMGVEHVADAASGDSAVAEWTSGRGPSVTIDAVGSPAVIRQCCALVAHAGRVVVVGLSDQDVRLPIVDFTYKEMTILGSRASAKGFPESIALVRRHRHTLIKMISNRFPLTEVHAAFALAIANPGGATKILIDVS